MKGKKREGWRNFPPGVASDPPPGATAALDYVRKAIRKEKETGDSPSMVVETGFWAGLQFALDAIPKEE